ncbi:MAG: ATP-dependent DNA helicase [Gammaproteobacteria bacterium]|nr:ATP-dependent DNA helicase [Gammaproteobacteria bacterium]
MPRPQQATLAVAIADAIIKKHQLVVEAGTGTGKTFAYLIPCLLSGKKAIISTATKTLQDQLVQKDLPILIQALGLATRVQNLKGRSNYICHHRTQQFSEEGRLQSAACAADIAYVHEKLPQLTHGERSELPELSENSQAWPFVTSTLDNCMGRACDFHNKCFLMQARKRAIEADVVVINHHVFFADSRLKAEGFGELLPQAGSVIFDEAHQLADIATEFHGSQFGTRQLRDGFDDMLRAWPVLDLANQPFKQWSVALDHVLDKLWLAVPIERSDWTVLMKQSAFRDAWEDLLEFVERWVAALPLPDPNDESDLAQSKVRCLALHAMIHDFCTTETETVRWVEKFKRTVVFHATPLDIAPYVKTLLARYPSAYVFTSATLTVSNAFDCFIQPLGLTEPVTLHLPSPFDFEQQALLYLPRDLPDPKNPRYYGVLLDKALPIINACQGRCFFLFTSHRALQEMADLLRPRVSFPILVQGEEAKPILLARFRSLGNAVLLGTATFWEGVDVKGDSLSCVIIDKIPFASPKDPVMQGKIRHCQAQGRSAFEEISLAAAVLSLKQGVGRLLRDVSDRGVLMIADPRLTGRAYGEQIFASLPPLRKTRDAQTVLTFIERGFRT